VQKAQTDKAAKAGWWALALLGRLGHALGFRWIFWWTLPIPYHPLVPVLLLLTPAALVVRTVQRLFEGTPAPVSWPAFLITGLVLAIPLSFPIFNMMFFALRVQLAQGACFLAAMVLLAAEVIVGRTASPLAILPILYFGAHAWQFAQSRRATARIRRQAKDYRPLALGGRAVELQGEQIWSEATELLKSGVTNIVCCNDSERTGSVSLAGNSAVVISAEDGRKFQEMMPKSMRPDGWNMVGPTVIQTPGYETEPEVKIAWDSLPTSQRKPTGKRVTICDGDDCQEVISAEYSTVMPVPLFMLFYMLAWSGNGRSFWICGFWRGRTQPIGLPRPSRYSSFTPNLFAPEPPVQPVDAGPLFQRLEVAQRRMLEEALTQLIDYLAGRIRYPVQVHRLMARPHTLAGLGADLCDSVLRAKERGDEAGARLGAELLALIHPEEFRSLKERLIPILGSRILALRWELTPDLDPAPLPIGCPRFGKYGGYGLMEKVPQLWERLDELGTPGARITAALIREVGELAPLAKAKSNFAGHE
jgi:hypothetical protein